MGETAGRMRRDDDVIYRSSDVTDVTVHATDDPDVLEAEIEHTRLEMSETIDEIAERLNPDHLKQQAKEQVREATIGRVQDMASSATDRAEHAVSSATDTAKETGTSIVDTIKRNPIPAALAGVGIGWLWKNRSSSQSSSSRRSAYPYYGQHGYGYPQTEWQQRASAESGDGGLQQRAGQVTQEAREKAGQVTGEAREQFGHLTQQAGELGHEAMDQVSHFGTEAKDQVSHLGTEAQDQMQQLKQQYNQMMRENPLGVGVAALGLGLAVGLLVPETRKENQLMGEARDSVMERVESTARQTVDKVEQVAEAATQSARDAAQQEGLTGQ